MTFITQEQSSLVAKIAEKLIARGETVCVAESSSGGLVSACLLSFPGASKFFIGGGVLYSYPIREAIVGLGAKEHEHYGGCTPELVNDLASLFQKKVPAVWSLGEAGAAGPSKSPYGHAAGYTVVAINGPIKRSKTIETQSNIRAENMALFTTALLQLFYEVLSDQALNSDQTSKTDKALI